MRYSHHHHCSPSAFGCLQLSEMSPCIMKRSHTSLWYNYWLSGCVLTSLDTARPGSWLQNTHTYMSCTQRWGGFAPGCASSSEGVRQRDRKKAPALRKGGKCETGERKEERPDMKPLLTAGLWLVLLFFLGGESASAGGPSSWLEAGFHFSATCES